MALHSPDFFTMTHPCAIQCDDPPSTERVVATPPKKVPLRTLKNLKGKTAHAIFPFFNCPLPFATFVRRGLLGSVEKRVRLILGQ
jgi:hypothetical protein